MMICVDHTTTQKGQPTMQNLIENNYYQLPDGLNWQGVKDQRERYKINPNFAPICAVPSCTAWGVVLDSNLITVAG